MTVAFRAILGAAGRDVGGGGGGIGPTLILDDPPPEIDLSVSAAAFKGWEFTLATPATMTAFRWWSYLGSSTTTAVLFRVSDTSVIATAQFTAAGTNSNQWDEVAITPIALAPGVNYVIGLQRTASDGTNPSHMGYTNPAGVTLGEGVTYVQGRERTTYSSTIVLPTVTTTNIWYVDAVLE